MGFPCFFLFSFFLLGVGGGSGVLTHLIIYNTILSFQIRRKMREIMTNQATSCDLKELVRKFIPEMIGKEIEKATSSIYPLQNVFIRKVKILKAPKFDLGKLMEVFPFYYIFIFFYLLVLIFNGRCFNEFMNLLSEKK